MKMNGQKASTQVYSQNINQSLRPPQPAPARVFGNLTYIKENPQPFIYFCVKMA